MYGYNIDIIKILAAKKIIILEDGNIKVFPISKEHFNDFNMAVTKMLIQIRNIRTVKSYYQIY